LILNILKTKIASHVFFFLRITRTDTYLPKHYWEIRNLKYSDPELYKQIMKNRYQDFDIWALGATVFHLIKELQEDKDKNCDVFGKKPRELNTNDWGKHTQEKYEKLDE
jgi:hypothetical protein